MIRDENGRLVAYVYVDTDSRDIGGYVERAKNALDAALVLAPGYGLEWAANTSSK